MATACVDAIDARASVKRAESSAAAAAGERTAEAQRSGRKEGRKEENNMAATLNHICQSSSSVRVLALNGEVLDAHKSRSTSVAGNVHYSLSVGWGARRLHVNRKALSGKKFGPAPAADIRATSGAEVIQQNVPATCDLKSFQEAVEKLEVDLVTEADLKENGFRSSRRTKICCTIGPACCSFEQLEALANGGMNIARLNMCHGTKEWHKNVIKNIRHLNATKGYCVALMMDTEGSEIHMGDLGGTASAKAEDGEEWTFTVRQFDGPLPPCTIQVNYEGFAEDVKAGDELVVDGGLVRFDVLETIGPDDWLDIDFGISEGVDFIAVSYVKSPEVVKHLKSYISSRCPEGSIGVFAKIEAIDSLNCLESIIRVSDGAMVARGDLGAQIPLELVPSVQQKIIDLCRFLNKPVMVASQLLESMIEYPIPTRAEVADVAEAVRQRADVLMLSGESAMGLFPEKSIEVLRNVSLRIEHSCREDKSRKYKPLPELYTALSERISEQICNAAAEMANNLRADAIFVYTRQGYMASLLSRNRPDCPIFAFTETRDVRHRLNMQWGLLPFRLDFSEDIESNLRRTFALLKARGMMKAGDLVIAVSDNLLPTQQANMLQSIQVRRIP
ncbi:hypothetical protein AXG93_1864s1310 [Marchantia polymorpha subsp. ruderalis]|uniref:Pyruvate kinase n=1 Tax=Marchantia polymorpha subsp. ruderalis TaxID=1480154 RepID=A0A176WR44_MARPO|nr:hypothetical protein AXG93_1864s1310 [Marchantia polymorpha subsp. ruderalis]